jgi:adenosine deaminase
MDLSQLPKVELHLHLDCSLSYDVVQQLDPAIRSLDDYTERYVAPPKCSGLADFLSRTRASVALLQTGDALRLATHDLFRQLQEDGVIYAELRFAPLLHTERGLSPADVVAIVDEATAQASAATGVQAGLILCTLRSFSEAQSLQTVRLVEQFRQQGKCVVAFDIAADEALSLDPHVAAFQYAAACGIPRTAHAGEARGAASVNETLDRLQPSRIGHGVRSIEDAPTVERLKQDSIHLEICPACNVQIDIYPTYADHPIDRLYREGVSLGVNTDTRGVGDTTLTRDYMLLAEHFGWTAADFLHVNLNALAASFAPKRIKDDLAERLRREYAPLLLAS